MRDSTPLKHLRRDALAFRCGILNGKPSASMCFAVCAPLQSLLGLQGIETELIEGAVGKWEHFWLRLPDGRVLDPTADQFRAPGGKTMPNVYIGALPGWYRVGPGKAR